MKETPALNLTTVVTGAAKWIRIAQHHLQSDGVVDRSMICKYLNNAMFYLERATEEIEE